MKSSEEVMLLTLGSDTNSANQDITVSRGYLKAHIAIAGIATSRGVGGNTTGAGMNIISYDSSGFYEEIMTYEIK